MKSTTRRDLSGLESSCWHPRRLELPPLHSSEPEARFHRVASADFETDLASRASRDESCRVWRWDGRCRLLPVNNGLSQKDNTNETFQSMTLAKGAPTLEVLCQNGCDNFLCDVHLQRFVPQGLQIWPSNYFSFFNANSSGKENPRRAMKEYN